MLQMKNIVKTYVTGDLEQDALKGVSISFRENEFVSVLGQSGSGKTTLLNIIGGLDRCTGGDLMQRVAIARTLINNPDILLADEPTGALDSETSVQIMELLKEIAKDKLVIMVTHNPELAEKYSTRIVKLLDGEIISDSNPYSEDEERSQKAKHKKISMSFFTALSLSFNNLRTKKGRTLLTAFAGSIGIIGIALILALSAGMNAYIADVQKDTMASYPITISSEAGGSSGNSSGGNSGIMSKLKGSAGLGGGSSSGAANFSELMAGSNGETVSKVITDSYDVLYGAWPEEYDEIVLVLNEDNGISAETLYQLGLITEEQYTGAVEKIEKGEDADEINFSYEDVCGHTFYLVPACDHYIQNENGTFTYIDDIALNEEKLLENAVELTVTGVIRPKEDAQNASISTAAAYTSKLTDYVIAHTDESAVIKAQEADSEINALTGTDMNGMAMDETTMAAALDQWLTGDPDREVLLKVYDEYIAGSTYEENMKAFGKVSCNAPASISIYTDSFENKDEISACIESYNDTAAEDDRITYTDYVALLTSSITTIINGISYVLVAFVAISLIVSCIMIGIITHISVMERTKEIGILRALGASKWNISQVFNAETFIIGCCAGLIGIGVSLLALIPINSIIEKLSGLTDLEAQLSLTSSVILITISIVITIIGGLLPAKKAAKMDPVIALRTE